MRLSGRFAPAQDSQRTNSLECYVSRDMPGYPKVDNQSDFLISRFDGAILDAKPWGRASLEEPQAAESLGYRERLADTLAQLHGLEVCHPCTALGFVKVSNK